MNLLSQLKGVHWAAIGLAVAGFGLAQLSKDPALASYAPILNWLAGILATGGMGTALGAHKVGFTSATITTTTGTVPAAIKDVSK